MTGLDCTGLHLTNLDLNVAFSERQFTLMDDIALPLVVLHFSQQDCIVLDIALQIEIHCTVLQWAGLPGLDWTALHLTGLECCSWLSWSWAVPDGNTLQSTCMDGTLLEWTAVSGTRLD